jgi:Ca2+/H+ antiporter, TMEM165/GDT1 family
MVSLYGPALVGALLITVLEMTEIVALVVALGHEGKALRAGAVGAFVGIFVVGGAAVLSAAAIESLPRTTLLAASASLLGAFGVFLFQSTLRSFRRARAMRGALAGAGPERFSGALPFAGGFSIGAIETLEAVVVLLAFAAAGYGASAVVGAFIGGGLLALLAWLLHGQIRKIKVVWLKLGATALLFSFAVFWGGEAIGVDWPGADLILVPFFLAGLLLVRAGVALWERRPMRVQTNS